MYTKLTEAVEYLITLNKLIIIYHLLAKVQETQLKVPGSTSPWMRPTDGKARLYMLQELRRRSQTDYTKLWNEIRTKRTTYPKDLKTSREIEAALHPFFEELRTWKVGFHKDPNSVTKENVWNEGVLPTLKTTT